MPCRIFIPEVKNQYWDKLELRPNLARVFRLSPFSLFHNLGFIRIPLCRFKICFKAVHELFPPGRTQCITFHISV